MYFKQIQEIVEGKKTATRRVCKPPKFTGMGVPIGGEYAIDVDGDKVIDHLGNRLSDKPIHAVYTITARGDRLKGQVGRDYAVQPGRGKPGVFVNFNHPCYGYDIWDGTDPVHTDKGLIDWREFAPRQGYQPLRIRLLEIRREPLQAISEEDAVAEGCEAIECDWCHNPLKGEPPGFGCPYCNGIGIITFAIEVYSELWETINGPKSWDVNPVVWALTFEVVQ